MVIDKFCSTWNLLSLSLIVVNRITLLAESSPWSPLRFATRSWDPSSAVLWVLHETGTIHLYLLIKFREPRIICLFSLVHELIHSDP